MAKDRVETALGNIDAQIAALTMARAILVDAADEGAVESEAPKPKRRGRKPKGLPAPETSGNI